jgi:AraC-like DNA-binding protein
MEHMVEAGSEISNVRGAERSATRWWRAAELSGVEVRELREWSEQWRCFCVGFEFVLSETWRGRVVAHGFRAELEPGSVFCCYPGEVYTTPKVHLPGRGRTLSVAPEVLFEHLAKHGIRSCDVRLGRIAPYGSRFSRSLARLVRAFGSDTTASERTQRFDDFVSALAREIRAMPSVSPLAAPSRRLGSKGQGACPPAESVEPRALDAWCTERGVTRLQALRAFKRSYGLPPHAYALCVRVGLAQRALRAGTRAAHVAAELGFVDQSHLSRHFKRIVGVTPAAYASSRSRGGLTVLSP